MISDKRKFLFILTCVELCAVFGIQVPTYSQGYSDKYNSHPKQLRQTSGYRFPTPKYKKSVNHAPFFRQEINYNSPAPFSDAIRIVDPPSFFEEQKKHYHKSFGDGNFSKRPIASAWKQQNVRASEYRSPPSPPKHKKSPQKYLEFRPEYRPQLSSMKQQEHPQKSSGHQSTHFPVKHQSPPSLDIQEYRPTAIQHHQSPQKHIKYHSPPPPSKELDLLQNVEEYQPSDDSPTYATSYHSLDIEHTKPSPTYLGIQTPNSGSIRTQLQHLKDRQKTYFEDEIDEFPVRQKKPIKKKRKKLTGSTENPSASFGHDIYNEERENFKKLKDDYFGVKVHSASPTTTEMPEESKNNPQAFIPYRMLASVRHTNRINHKPRDPSDPRAKARFRTEQAYTVHTEQAFEENKYDHVDEERHADRQKKVRNQRNVPQTYTDHLKDQSTNITRTKRSPPKPKQHITIKKVQTVYSEQGFEDLEYDHGDELRHADYKKKYRLRRSVNSSPTSELIEQVEELPVALSLVGPDGRKLTGDALMRHITQLLKNSSKYLREEQNESKANVASVIIPPEQLEGLLKTSSRSINPPQFSHQHLDTSLVPEGSAIKYAERVKNFNESPYEKESLLNCDEGEYNFQQNSSKKKLGNLGKQLDCFKEKFFGKNPLSNPIFEDDVITPASPLLKAEVQNPSSLVYDDVMKTIKNSLKSERHLAIIPIPENAARTGLADPRRFESYSQPSTVAPKIVYQEIYTSLPVFDITKYFPKVYMIRPNGKIYSIKFRPKQSSTPVTTPNAEMKRRNRQNVPQSNRTKVTAHRETLPMARVVEPSIVYKFSQEDAVRRPSRGQHRFSSPV